MKIFLDFHIHSRFSRACSPDMNLRTLEKAGRAKGLSVLGTGDFTHPEWLKELKAGLKMTDGIYKTGSGYGFILTTEVANIYEQDGKTHKVHNVLIAPDFETVEQINELLKGHGSLSSDGRPILDLACPEMVEGLMKISKDILIVPAHCMTPWFGVFGSKSGFDSMEECFKDQTKHIFALETGMSADPAMLWRLSKLDKYALVSNSDSHSANIAKLGRECNVLELPEASYKGIINAIRTHNPDKFLFTVEVDPGFGKYHWDGHRNCKVEFEPQVSIKHGNICPVCKRKLTIGVEHRIEDLADRPAGFKLKGAVPFKRLLPLVEVIAGVMGIQQALSPKVMRTAFELIERFGTEMRVLLEIPEQQLAQHVDAKIAAAIIRNRNGEIPVQPGYDGVFGKPLFDASEQIKRTRSPQKTLERYV